jgi:exopolysaccharide biosynthesis polyprenyl glycosylphosphotransferase
MGVDLLVVTGAFVLAALAVAVPREQVSFQHFLALRLSIGNAILFVLFLGMWNAQARCLGLYRSHRLSSAVGEAVDVIKAAAFGATTIAVAGWLLHVRFVTMPFLVVFVALLVSLLVVLRLGLRLTLRWARRRGRNLRDVVVVGTNARALGFVRALEARRELGYRVLGFIDRPWAGGDVVAGAGYRWLADLEAFPEFLRLHVVDEVLVCLPLRSLYGEAARVAAVCQEQGVPVRVVSTMFDLRGGHCEADVLDGTPVVTIAMGAMDGVPMTVKRLIDVAGSLALLLLLAPVFLAVAIAIRLDSAGPVFFVQGRLGLSKRRFRMYKFRTMVPDAEKLQRDLVALNEVAGAAFKIKDDPRVTRVGRFLRATSIDELPQLANVLKGDMSLVGPRPLPVRDYEHFSHDWHRRRFSVRPGMTCLWQVDGRHLLPFERWMELDLLYIDRWSLALDLRILLRTIPAVLKGSGAS